MLKFEDLPTVNSKRWFSLNALEGEIWKEAPGYEGMIKVSNYSRILNVHRNCILRQFIGNTGYLKVALRTNGKYKHISVHRLVLMAFISNEEEKPCADHIDTNKLNNTLNNLRWTTHKENANNILTKKHRKYSHINTLFSDKKVAKLDKDDNVVCVYNSVTEAALDNGIKKCSISNAAHRRMMPNKYGKYFECRKAGGFKWKYV